MLRPARLLAIVSAIYLAITAVYYVDQRHYLFHVSAAHIAPAKLNLTDVAEMALHTRDGETLVAWYGLPARGMPTVFYLHGNAGTLGDRADRVRRFRGAGYGIFMLAYRGFSGSTGSPTEAAIVGDALMAYDRLETFTPADSRIVVYGESLGTGVAVQVAAKRKPAGLVLESPFSSAADVGAYLYPFLPVHWLLKDRFESIDYIHDVTAPLLVLHGEDDPIVPPYLGRRLLAAAPGPKQGYFIAGADHYTLYQHGAFDKIRSFLDRLKSGPDLPPGTMTVLCPPGCMKLN